MTKKHIIKELKLDEISSVTKPAQSHALAAIIKSGETKSEDGKEFPASDYAYVPDPEKPSTWKLRLTSEPGGKPDTGIVGAAAAALGEGFRGNKVEIPDGDRAAVVARVRRAWREANPDKDTDSMPDALKKSAQENITKALNIDDGAASFLQFMESNNEYRRKWEAREEVWPLFGALQDSIYSIIGDTSISVEDQSSRIRQSIEEFSGAMQSRVPDANEELSKIWSLNSEEQMSDEVKKMADLEKKVAELESKNAELDVLAKMSDEEKEHLASLKDDDAKKAFTSMSADERKSAMKKSADSDETVELEGRTIRKSVVGEDMFAVLKSQADRIAKSEADIKKAQDEALTVRLTKIADEDYSHLPGETVEKVALLKAVDSLDAKVKETLTTMLKAADAALSPAFAEIGYAGSKSPADLTKADKLEKKIAEHMAKNTGVTKEAAQVAVLAANPELYEG